MKDGGFDLYFERDKSLVKLMIFQGIGNVLCQKSRLVREQKCKFYFIRYVFRIYWEIRVEIR